MKQTAVEWLAEQITTAKWRMSDVTDRNSIIDQAKAMEKEQIKNAWLVDGYTDISNDYWKKEFEEYYNETFKSDGLV